MKTFVKTFLVVLLLSLSSVSIAGPHNNRHGYYQSPARHHGHHHWHHNHNWVAPLIIGGALGYALTRPTVVQTPIVEYQTVTPVTTVIQTQQVECSEWREVQYADGRIVKERTCIQR